jgi:hypothetical protein
VTNIFAGAAGSSVDHRTTCDGGRRQGLAAWPLSGSTHETFLASIIVQNKK